MNRFVSPQPLEVPAAVDEVDLSRADLVFYGVEHGGASYEARVFLDQPDADEETPTDLEHGYAGSYTVFGHAGCFGQEGHCAPSDRTTDEFDRRGPHALQPWTKTVMVTECLRAALARSGGASVTLTVVPVVAEVEHPRDDMPEAFAFSEVRLLTYEDE